MSDDCSYLLVRANYKTNKSVVCVDDSFSYLLSVSGLSSVISDCLDFGLLLANYMSGGL